MRLLTRSFFLLVFFVEIILLAGWGSNCKMPSMWNASTATEQNPATNAKGLTENDLKKMTKDEIINFLKVGSATPNQTFENVVDMSKSLSFQVLNKTNKHVFVKCFYWMRNKSEGPFRWDNSDVYSLKPLEKKLIMIDDIPLERDRKNCIGFLGVFEDEEKAKQAHKLICDESKLIDLDSLYALKNKVVTLIIKKYGIEGEQLEHQSISYFSNQNKQSSNLDLFVENKTGKDAWITCFIYEQPENTQEFDSWRYSKTPVQLIRNNQLLKIAIPEVMDKYKWSYMRGTLGVFWKKEKEIAKDATVELLDPEEKLKLGLLSAWAGKKIVLQVENYGVIGDFIDYVVKPMQFYNRRTNKKELIGKKRKRLL